MAEESLGDVAPRKGPGGLFYLFVAIAVGAVIGGVMLFTGDKGDNSSSNANPTTPVTTITQLKASVTNLSAKLDAISGRLSNVESVTATMTAPTVTKADINALQVDINDLSDEVANWSNVNSSSNLDYWLTKDKDDDVYLHIISADSARFIAEVTVFYDDPTVFGDMTYSQALSCFYNKTGTDRDYLPNFVPSHTVATHTTTCHNYSLSISNGTALLNDATTVIIPICYNTTITTSDWEYSTITFCTDSFKITAGEESSKRIKYIPEDYDTISVRLLPSLEASESGEDDGV